MKKPLGISPWVWGVGGLVAILGAIQIAVIVRNEKNFERRKEESAKRRAAFEDVQVRESIDRTRQILDNERQLQEELAKDAESRRRIEAQARKNEIMRRKINLIGAEDGAK